VKCLSNVIFGFLSDIKRQDTFKQLYQTFSVLLKL
jgi:hypothetical protein